MNALAQEASDADPQAQATAACLDRNVLRAQYGQRISPYASCPKLTESASLSFDTKEACVQGLQKKYERAPQSGAGVEKLEEPICTYRLLEVATCSLAASREYAASEGADPNFDPCLVNNGIAGKQIPAQAQELIRNTCRNHLAAYQGACFQRSKGELSEMGQAKKDKFGRPIK
ncbi:MAG: hypothetical protein LBM75_06475 [Myxococcales bacterium]|nr:hypothetical protein [Myxococcales bacterium]